MKFNHPSIFIQQAAQVPFLASKICLAEELFPLLFFEVVYLHFTVCLMLHEIEANDFVNEVDAQPAILLEGVEEQETEEGGPARVGERADYLYVELLTLSCIKEAFVLVENACG